MTSWICSNADSKVNHMIVWRHWTQLRMAVYQQSHWPSAPENWPTSRSFLFHRDKLHSALSPLKSLHISLLLTLSLSSFVAAHTISSHMVVQVGLDRSQARSHAVHTLLSYFPGAPGTRQVRCFLNATIKTYSNDSWDVTASKKERKKEKQTLKTNGEHVRGTPHTSWHLHN